MGVFFEFLNVFLIDVAKLRYNFKEGHVIFIANNCCCMHFVTEQRHQVSLLNKQSYRYWGKIGLLVQ